MKTIALLILLLSIFFVCRFFHLKSLDKKIANIKKNEVITTGVITNVRFVSYKGDVCNIEYDFIVNGKTFTTKASVDYYKEHDITRNDLIYKKFPVIYSSKNVENNSMLITVEDSLKYGL